MLLQPPILKSIGLLCQEDQKVILNQFQISIIDLVCFTSDIQNHEVISPPGLSSLCHRSLVRIRVDFFESRIIALFVKQVTSEFVKNCIDPFLRTCRRLHGRRLTQLLISVCWLCQIQKQVSPC